MSVLDAPSWTPSVQDVANFLLSRTRLPNGTLAGTFTSNTMPTDEQVAAIVTQQVSLFLPRLGDVPDALSDSARALLALQSATVVESSYFTEQIDSGSSPYHALCGQFATSWKAYMDAASGDVPNGYRTGTASIGTLYPGYAFGTW